MKAKFVRILIYILFTTCIIFPFHYYEIKLPLLLILAILSIFNVLKYNKLNFNKSVLILFFIYVLAGSFFILRGLYLGTAYQNSLKYIFALYVLFPLIYFVLLAGIPYEETFLTIINKILKIGIIGVSLTMILAFFNQKYGYFSFLEFIFKTMIVDLRTNVVKINYHGISSMLFLFPYWFMLLIFEKKNFKQLITYLLIIALSVIAIFLSGRRALIMLFLFSGLFTISLKFIFSLNYSLKIKRNTVFLIVFLFILSAFMLNFINIEKIYNNTLSTIKYGLNLDNNTSSEKSDNERIKQIKSFIKKIPEKPVLGYGHGASLGDVVRSEDKPWRYEMSYFNLIFHTGIIGFILYSLGPLWIIFSLLNFSINDDKSRPLSLAFLNGFIIIFLAYFTNPYLNAFDIQWVIYLPVYYILLRSKRNINISK